MLVGKRIRIFLDRITVYCILLLFFLVHSLCQPLSDDELEQSRQDCEDKYDPKRDYTLRLCPNSSRVVTINETVRMVLFADSNCKLGCHLSVKTENGKRIRLTTTDDNNGDFTLACNDEMGSCTGERLTITSSSTERCVCNATKDEVLSTSEKNEISMSSYNSTGYDGFGGAVILTNFGCSVDDAQITNGNLTVNYDDVEFFSGDEVGEYSVTVQCEYGHVLEDSPLVNSKELICQHKNGEYQWNGSITCVAVYCYDDPPLLSNGQRETELLKPWLYQNTVVYKCDEDYTGAPRSTCLSNGKWSDPEPCMYGRGTKIFWKSNYTIYAVLGGLALLLLLPIIVVTVYFRKVKKKLKLQTQRIDRLQQMLLENCDIDKEPKRGDLQSETANAYDEHQV